MNRSYFTALFLFFTFFLTAESIRDLGLPFISNYDRNDYNAGTQNWCIAQDQDQVMWFGNQSVLLWYDGVEWGQVSISNYSVVRSLLSSLNGHLLVGAFQEFGELTKDVNGSYSYVSWLDRLPLKYHNFSDIVKIHEYNGECYFQSNEYIFVFKEGEFQRAYAAEKAFFYSFIANNRLYIVDKGIGLKELMNDGLRLAYGGHFFANKEVWFLDYFNGALLAITQNEGMFRYINGRWQAWECPADAFLKKHSFYSGLRKYSGELLLGTVQNGLIICDKNGQIKKHINKRRGLYNNTVLSMYIDIEHNLWLGLDHGISYLKINSPFTQLVNVDGFGTGYASLYTQDYLYLGTNQGLYYRSTKEGPVTDYKLILGSQGQVWALQQFNGTVFCSHHKGLYIVEGDSIILVPNTEACWKVLPYPNLSDTYIVGMYTGLGRLEKKDGAWLFSTYDGFEESSRVMEFDEYNNLWMSHGYKGVYKLAFKDHAQQIESVRFFGKADGLPSDRNNEVFKYNDEVAIASIYQVYKYNAASGKMEPYQQLNEDYPLYTQITKVFSNTHSTSYLFSGGKLHRASFQKGSMVRFDSKLFLPLQGRFVPAFENIFFITNDLFIIGVADGFVLYDGSVGSDTHYSIPLNIKQITCANKSTFSTESDTLVMSDATIDIPYSMRNLSIKYAIPLYENPSNIISEVRLNGELLNEEMINNHTIELNQLDYGNYNIMFTVRDIADRQEATSKSFYFRVLPPWYLQWYVVVTWIVLLFTLSLVTFILARKRIEIIKRKEKIRQQRKHIKEQIALKRKAARAEQRLTHLKNETLQKQNRQKAEEIANSTMELVEKNKMLLMVKDTLKSIQTEKDINTRNSIIRHMLKTIDRDLNNKEKWKIFEENFDEVHQDFLNRFKEKHPNITAKDMRLCAFLRMNLSSKEIAPLLSISIRSVEISRYRLRKKIDLPHDVNLTDYIVHF